MNHTLIRYYMGAGPDHKGRTLAEILRQGDDWLEITHDYVQWLFPLPELSRASSTAPLLDNETIAAFQTDELLQRHLRAAVSRMIQFYGLTFDGQHVGTRPNWPQRRLEWFTESTHNSLRITRMLRAMSLLGLKADSRALANGLDVMCGAADCKITAESRRFWQSAAG